MSTRLQVFVSSKMQELAPEREAIKSALRELHIDAFVFESDAGARPGTIRQTYLQELDDSDLYIGLFWNNYGEYTIDEFESARAANKDCLIYEKREAIQGVRDPALQTFLDRLEKVETGLTMHRFHRLDELGAFVKEDVARWQADVVRRTRLSQHTVPFQAPPRSDRYIDRTDLQAALLRSLLPSAAADRPPLSRAVLHGIGGIGKTSLAIALAHHPDMRRAFPHGVLWVSLDRSPNLLQLLSAWGRALGDSQAGNLGYPDLAGGVSQLRTLLRDRACLLVVDDAWKGEHVESAFLVGGPRCQLLVTTRQAEVAEKLDAALFELEGMAEAEALALFERWSGPIPEAGRAIACGLARQVDYLPLALELIGGQVRRAGGWSEYRALWDARLDTLKRGRRASGRDDNLIDSLEVSVNALPPSDRAAYLQLAVFPLGTMFPASAAAALWNSAEPLAAELLSDLADQALVSRRRHRGKPWFTLHALLHDYVSTACGSEGLVNAHRALIEGYRKRCAGDWPSAADDGYLFDSLSRHLVAAGLHAELYALVNRPWMQAQFARSESHRPFVLDLKLVLDAAGAEQPRNWPMMARCSHAIACLHAQSADMSVLLLEALARMGRTARALQAASLIPDPWRRSAGYLKVGQILVETGSREQAADAFERAIEAAEQDTAHVSRFIAEQLAAAAEGLHLCGDATAADRLRQADACLRTDQRLMNRSGCWEALARAHAAIEGRDAALGVTRRWLEETEAAPSHEALYAAPNLAQALAAIGGDDGGQLERLALVALHLRQQGYGDWVLSETIVALTACGGLAKACELLPKIHGGIYFLPAATACGLAAQKAGDAALAERILTGLYDAVRQRASENGRLELKDLTSLRKLVVGIHGLSGLERFTRALAPIADPVWRALALSQLAVAAADLGATRAAAEHTAETSRVLTEALQKGPLHGEDIRADAAVSLFEAGQWEESQAIVDAITERTSRQKAWCRLTLKLLELGDVQRAEVYLDRARADAAVAPAPEAVEVTAAAHAAQSLIRAGAAEAARGILQAAQDKASGVRYESYRAGALVSVAAAWRALAETANARQALGSALPLLDEFWDEINACQVFELAATLYDAPEFEKARAILHDNWQRDRSVLAGVVKGLVARNDIARAQQHYDDVRRREPDFLPWFETPKAESLVEFAQLDNEKVLQWLEDGGAFEDPALQASLLGHVAAAWMRLARADRATEAIDRALACAAEIAPSDARHHNLAEIAAELAAARVPALAMRAAQLIPEGPSRDDALCRVALALVEAGSYSDAVTALRAAQDRSQPAGRLTDIADRLADAGEYDMALTCAREASLDRWIPYLAAAAARRLAILQRPAEARAMLLLAADDSALQYDYVLRALGLARRAQALSLLGQSPEAGGCVAEALDLTWAVSGAYVWAWCADALARIGDAAGAARAAEKALQAAQEIDGDWDRVGHFEIAAAGLADAGTLDTERILALVGAALRRIRARRCAFQALSALAPRSPRWRTRALCRNRRTHRRLGSSACHSGTGRPYGADRRPFWAASPP